MIKRPGNKKQDVTYDRCLTIAMRIEMANEIEKFCEANNIRSFSAFFREAAVYYMYKKGVDITSLK